MGQHLAGVAVQFYRGVGHETQIICPFSTMNFFIGANNSGKSIVLSLISSQLSQLSLSKVPPGAHGTDEYRGEKTGAFSFAIGYDFEPAIKKILQKNGDRHFENKYNYRMSFEETIRQIFDIISHEGLIWLRQLDPGKGQILFAPSIAKLEEERIDWGGVWKVLTMQSGGSAISHWIPETLREISQMVATGLPSVNFIPAKRIVGDSGEEFHDLSGRGLIDHLATLQNPSWNKQEDRATFGRINRFLQEVTGKRDAVLEIPSDRKHILVHMDNKVLPLSSLGTGIHEVVLIAAFCTIHDGSIMCLEEPEIHLHPVLQRKLLDYLMKETSSQYFIATHSSVFVDTVNSSIFHVHNDSVQTYVKLAKGKSDKSRLLDSLGYRASDLLQSNAVIWVEGPSDRIYLKNWINALDPSLKEGVDFSIMFYGGALIRHLSASDAALEEFISLNYLNRHMAILLDSDRDSPTAELKPAVQRIVTESLESNVVVWVTKGREVENYVQGKVLQAALEACHPRLYVAPAPIGIYDHSFYFFRDDPKHSGRKMMYKDADKVGVAAKVCELEADLSVLDLKERVSEIVSMIRNANGLG